MAFCLSVLFIFLEGVSMTLFFDSFQKRRKNGNKFWCTLLFLLIVNFGILNLLNTRVSIIKLIWSFLLFLCINGILYQGEVFWRFLTTSFFLTFEYVFSFLIETAFRVLFHLDYNAFIDNHALYITAALSSFFVLLLFAGVLKHFRQPKNVSSHIWAAITLLIPLSSLCLMISFYMLSTQYEPLSHYLAAFSIALCIIDIGAVILTDWLEQSAWMREQALAANTRLVVQEQSIEALSAAYTAQRKMTHDFRHHLAVLSEMLSQEEAPAAAHYVQELKGQHTARILPVNTHSATMDAILNQKAQHAKKCGIDMRFEVNDLAALKIREIDYVSVLANLLDNAMEACEKLEESRRWIAVKVLLENVEPTKDGTLFISVQNESPPVKIIGDSINTTKQNPSLHGFGLPSIQEVLSRYGAEYVMVYENNTFLFSTEWPNVVC